ncbi:MAG: hypothetical protein HZA07_07775 [Nitrospirae bacterium]|nr:hypothetical protein [Nitrospirota bacterium]
MIDRQEIMDFSREFGLAVNVIEKDEDFLNKSFKEVAGWVYDASGIEVPHDLMRFEVYEEPSQYKVELVIEALYNREGLCPE